MAMRQLLSLALLSWYVAVSIPALKNNREISALFLDAAFHILKIRFYDELNCLSLKFVTLKS